MLLLMAVWLFLLGRMRKGTGASPAKNEQTELLRSAAKALERIAALWKCDPYSDHRPSLVLPSHRDLAPLREHVLAA